jgi:hypothetical protein
MRIAQLQPALKTWFVERLFFSRWRSANRRTPPLLITIPVPVNGGN